MRFVAGNLWRRRRWRLAFAWTAGVAVVAALGFLGYRKLVEGAWIKYNKWDRRERGALRVGQQAPDLELPLVNEGSVRLSELWRERPVFLVFGSCTWPPFRKKIGDLHRIYDAYKDKAHFLTIYISEAHPDDEWQTDSNRQDKFVFNQPRSIDDRRTLARLLPDRLKFRLPVAIDPMDDRADKAFAAWPERIYVLGVGGRIEYKADPGPFGFKPDEAEKSLKPLLVGGG